MVLASGRRQLACWLLDECARLQLPVSYDAVDGAGNSPVLYAAKYGWHALLSDWVDKLLNANVLNTMNKCGDTVLGCLLRFAAGKLLPEDAASAVVRKLIEKGAQTSLPAFKEKVPPIHLAAATDMMDVFNAVKASLQVAADAQVGQWECNRRRNVFRFI